MEESVDMEVFPDRITGGDISVNRQRLTLTFELFFDKIISSIDKSPYELRVLSYTLLTKVSSKYPDSGASSVGSFFFLRFICPGIMIPQKYGIVKDKPSENAQRSLILVAKILQALANKLPFQKKEESMMYFNSLLDQKRERFTHFVETLAQKPTTNDYKTPKTSSIIRKASLTVLENELVKIL